MACNKTVRSCVLAALHRHPERRVVVIDRNYDQAARDLQLPYGGGAVRRALDSLAFNADPKFRRVARTRPAWATLAYSLPATGLVVRSY